MCLHRPQSRRARSSNAWAIVYQQNGGFEVYDFIVQLVVHSNGFDGRCIASLSLVDKTFNASVKAEVVKLVPKLNKIIRNLYELLHHQAYIIEHTPNWQIQSQPSSEVRQRLQAVEARIGQSMDELMQKSCFHVVQSLKKILKEHVVRNGRVSDIDMLRIFINFSPRLATSARSFFLFSASHACELHSLDRCECSQEWGGSFCFVPQSRGLLMRCASSCLPNKSVVVRAFRSEPISVPNKRTNLRNESLVNAMMTVAGVHPPFSISALKGRIGDKTWRRYLHQPYVELSNNNNNSSNSSSLTLLSETHGTIAHDVHDFTDDFRVPTFQSLLRLSDFDVKSARALVVQADQVIAESRAFNRQLMFKFATDQFIRLVQLYLSSDEQHPNRNIQFRTLDGLNMQYPGIETIVKRSILSHAANTPIESIYSINLMSLPFTVPILNSIRFMETCMRQRDRALTGSGSSNLAYAFASGFCSGADPSHDFRDLSCQLSFGRYHDPSLITESELDASIAFMKSFDNVVPGSVRIRQVLDTETADKYRRFLDVADFTKILEFVFVVAGVVVKGPVAIHAATWPSEFNSKLVAAKQVWLSTQTNRTVDEVCALQNLPSLPSVCDVENVCSTMEAHIQFFMKFKSTRAIAFDAMSGNRTKITLCNLFQHDADLTNRVLHSLKE